MNGYMNEYSTRNFQESTLSYQSSEQSYHGICRKRVLTQHSKDPESSIWYEWMSNQIRYNFVLEIIFLMLLGTIIHNSYQISTQNEETFRLITNVRNEVRILKERWRKTPNEDFEQKKPSRIQANYPNPKPFSHEPIESALGESPPRPHRNSSAYLFNAANSLFGAVIINKNSQSEDSILLDRPNPPRKDAWCSEETAPKVTIELSESIKPVYVSYQHSKWNHAVPSDAPRIYDVVACLDQNCVFSDPLVSNCEYISNDEQQEQKCFIPQKRDLIKTVQFRFRDNYGDPNHTCISLIRVFGESKNKHVLEQRKNRRICNDLGLAYYNDKTVFNSKSENCNVLFTKGCCGVCPECCVECRRRDYTGALIFISFIIVIILFLFCWCVRTLKPNKKHRSSDIDSSNL